ncbi:MAG: gamma-glutamyl-gamma-aminobutyrate hydrolase family protein [Candidatus Aminicenantes bacterium]|nr:gamma-glutamyl-gamma-aminobutyrate hydrolase family protein [Candidatus Aminicenantes bacterium]
MRAGKPGAPAAVAIIDNSIDPGVYRPVEHWSRHLAVPWDAFVARDGCFPDPADYSHIILTGSEASILERDAWVDAEAGLVREAVAAGAAVLGSCWGHQLLAFALAGESHVRRCDRPEIGWMPIRVDKESGLLGPVGSPYMFSVHYDEVWDLPAPFEILASTDACPIQAFRLRGKPVWGLQGHPEVDIPTGLRFLRDLVDRGFKGRDFLMEALRRPPQDSGLILRIVRTFLESGCFREGRAD